MRSSARRRSAFSIVELLGVVAIVVLLMGVLLVALQAVREAGRRAETQGTMTQFANACEAFSLEHGFYPGVVPEPILATQSHEIIHGAGGVTISSTENAILHLQGGAVKEDDVTAEAWATEYTSGNGWVEYSFTRAVGSPLKVKINTGRIGEGPTIAGRTFAAYLPGAAGLGASDGTFGQWGAADEGGGGGQDHANAAGGGGRLPLPDLLDGWGRPIIYARQARQRGRLVWDAHMYDDPPQFFVDSLWPYTRAPSQVYNDPCGAGDGGSLLNSNYFTSAGTGIDPSIERRVLAAMLRSPASTDDPTDTLTPGTARAAFVLISAGSDGIYLATDDGPGSPKRHIGADCGEQPFPIEEFLRMGPTVFDSLDDIRYYGGAM